jgi:hypothetical protein
VKPPYEVDINVPAATLEPAFKDRELSYIPIRILTVVSSGSIWHRSCWRYTGGMTVDQWMTAFPAMFIFLLNCYLWIAEDSGLNQSPVQ